MKHAADRIARQLEQKGVRTATLHSNRSQNQRLRALKDFKSGAVRVLVATDIAARGIDVDGISHVVNYDFPMHVEDYIHRIGRTGRAHAMGDAISFVTPEDHGELRALERFIGRGIVRKKAEGLTGEAASTSAAPAAGAATTSRPDIASTAAARRAAPARAVWTTALAAVIARLKCERENPHFSGTAWGNLTSLSNSGDIPVQLILLTSFILPSHPPSGVRACCPPAGLAP
jgi:superfamily II DNA/RNA helicase